MSQLRKIELLAPAKDAHCAKVAIDYGADAVYLAGTDFGMRSFAGNFSAEELPFSTGASNTCSVFLTVPWIGRAHSSSFAVIAARRELILRRVPRLAT